VVVNSRAHERKHLARLPSLVPHDTPIIPIETKRRGSAAGVATSHWDVDAEAQQIELQLLLILLPRSYGAIAQAQLNLDDAVSAAELFALSDVTPKYVSPCFFCFCFFFLLFFSPFVVHLYM
jgi:hypothetical protein